MSKKGSKAAVVAVPAEPALNLPLGMAPEQWCVPACMCMCCRRVVYVRACGVHVFVVVCMLARRQVRFFQMCVLVAAVAIAWWW